MQLKFIHRWRRLNETESECVTTLAAHVASRVARDALMESGKVRRLVEEQNAKQLQYMLYDVPRGEFYRAYMDLLRNIQPIWGSDFEAARVRLFEFAGQLTKQTPNENENKHNGGGA